MISIVVVFFLAAQTCQMPGVTTGIASDCVGEGDIVCDGTEAYTCQLAQFGVGYFVSRTPENDIPDCGADSATEEVEEGATEEVEEGATEEVDLSPYETEATRIETALAYAQTNYDTFATEVTTVATDPTSLVNIKNQLKLLATEVDSLKSDITTLQTGLAAETADVSDLESTVSTLETDSDTLATDIQTLITDINALLASIGDTDGDGLTDYEELNTYSTDPNNVDTDGDGLLDGFEVTYGFSPILFDGETDLDLDGLTTLEEQTYGTDPTDADSDFDGLSDEEEVNTYSTDPLLTDSDGDSLSDGVEVSSYGTDPTLSDTDADLLADGDEITAGTDPLNDDSDGDILLDGKEATYSADPLDADTDNDNLPDGVEVKMNYDPAVETIPEVLNFYLGRTSLGTDKTYDYTIRSDGSGSLGRVTEIDGTLEGIPMLSTSILYVVKTGVLMLNVVDFSDTNYSTGLVFPTDIPTVTENVAVFAIVTPSSNEASGAYRIVMAPLSDTSSRCRAQYALGINNGKYTFNLNTDGKVYSLSGGTVEEGTTNSVLGVFTGSKMYLFVDGNLVAEEELLDKTETMLTSFGQLIIGAHNEYSQTTACTNLDYKGTMTKIKIWGN